MIRAHDIRLNPTPDQQIYFFKAAGTARYSYNWAVEQWKNAEGKKPKALELKKHFNAIKPAWVYEVTKCAAEGAFFDFSAATKNYYEGRTGEPQFKSRSRGHFSFYLSNDKFNVAGRWIYIPKLGLVNMAEKLRFKGKILKATIHKRANWWYASITVEMPDKPASQRDKAVGIDLGVKRLATLSDGSLLENAQPLRKQLARLAQLQQVFSRKQKGSKNRDKIKRKIGRLHKQIANIRDDILHKFTTHIANTYGFVGLEDLHVKGLVKNHNLALSMMDASLGRLTQLLESKLLAVGGELVKVDRFFPSSQLCSNCGHRQEIALSERTYCCPQCALTIDRDLNAAINILNEALRLADKPPSGSGYDGRKTPPQTGYNPDQDGMREIRLTI